MDRRKFIYKTSGFIAGSIVLNSIPFRVLGDTVIPDIAVVGLSGVALSLLATLYPAYLALRLAPVEGLRWQE